MDDLISRNAACDVIGEMIKEYREKGEDDLADDLILARRYGIKCLPAVDAVPIKPLSVWLAGYAVPPKYTVETNPVDSAKARAEGWEKHIRNLIECGLMEEE